MEIDLMRLATLAGYASVVVLAFRACRRAVVSSRKIAAALIGAVATMWLLFYAWVTPTFWGHEMKTMELRDLVSLASRSIHLSTALLLILLLLVIRQAENLSNNQAAEAAERIKKALS